MNRVVAVVMGMLAMIIFACACVWVASEGGDVSLNVLDLVMCAVIVAAIIAVNFWFAGERTARHVPTSLLIDELLNRPPSR